MAGGERLGASFSIDVTDLKAGLAQANRLIKESQSEFQAAAAGMDDWTKSEEGLTAKIKSLNQITEVQRQKVDALQEEYDRLIANGMDPTSKQAVELRTKINNETAALNKNEAELQRQTEALEELTNNSEEAGDAAEDMGDKFSGLKAAGGVAVKAIAAVGAAVAGAVTAFFALAESTREARNNMAKLETGFTQAGHSAEDAAKTYNELYSILGDDGQATEAAAHLAQLTTNEQELAQWTTIATGVYATFGDSLPIEGLTEAANETAKTGALTGGLADALNWAGVSEDEFQASLDACATEQERQALITETLNGLYADSAAAYRENNAEVIAAQRAQAELNAALNELGAIAEPIMTTLKTMATDLLMTITPFVSLMGEGLAGALSGTAGAADTLAQGISGLISTALQKIVEVAPFVIQTVTGIIPVLLTEILGQLPNILSTILLMVSDVAQNLAQMLPTLIPIVIDTVILLTETLLDNVDMLIDAGISLLLGLADGLILALPRLIEKIPVIIGKLISAITSNLPKLLQMGIELTVKLAAGIVQAIPQLLSKIPQIITAIVSGLKNGVGSLANVGRDLIQGLWNGISNMTGWILSKIRGFGSSVLNGLKNFFGIHSPAKLIEDEIGENIGLAVGTGTLKALPRVNKLLAKGFKNELQIPAVENAAGSTSGAGVTVYQTNNFKQAQTSQLEKYKAKQQLYAAARLIKTGAV